MHWAGVTKRSNIPIEKIDTTSRRDVWLRHSIVDRRFRVGRVLEIGVIAGVVDIVALGRVVGGSLIDDGKLMPAEWSGQRR